ncbi:hypothetical protein RMSM_04895 [Rhodopirellula maiorica SM1]|uniref:Uncharacterized protein n=1 Tax=Rhodopirellula maiorica SM1 TaxID=1265738 RepID=M5RW77_9BACT|nr:hypothetical protein RMSM_04895 [Rhodopirellula maiorica SM1]
MGFARIPIFVVETPGTLASPTTNVGGIGLAPCRYHHAWQGPLETEKVRPRQSGENRGDPREASRRAG